MEHDEGHGRHAAVRSLQTAVQRGTEDMAGCARTKENGAGWREELRGHHRRGVTRQGARAQRGAHAPLSVFVRARARTLATAEKSWPRWYDAPSLTRARSRSPRTQVPLGEEGPRARAHQEEYKKQLSQPAEQRRRKSGASKILAFKNKAPGGPEGYANGMAMRDNQNAGAGAKVTKRAHRHIPQAPERISGRARAAGRLLPSPRPSTGLVERWWAWRWARASTCGTRAPATSSSMQTADEDDCDVGVGQGCQARRHRHQQCGGADLGRDGHAAC